MTGPVTAEAAVTFRPRVLIITAVVLTLVMAGVCALGWFTLPMEIRVRFTTFQIVTLIGIAAIAVGLVWLMAVSTVRLTSDGVRVRNALRVRTVAWSQIRAVRYRPGEPWAALTLRTVDAEGVYGRQSLFALQRVDGERTVAGVRAVAAALRESRGSGADHTD